MLSRPSSLNLCWSSRLLCVSICRVSPLGRLGRVMVFSLFAMSISLGAFVSDRNAQSFWDKRQSPWRGCYLNALLMINHTDDDYTFIFVTFGRDTETLIVTIWFILCNWRELTKMWESRIQRCRTIGPKILRSVLQDQGLTCINNFVNFFCGLLYYGSASGLTTIVASWD